MNKSILFLLFVFGSICTITAANASQVQVPVTLTIDDILSSDNPYSLSIGDKFQWQVEYDDTKIITSEEEEWLYPMQDPSLQINGIIGTFSFDIGDTSFFGPLAPVLHFTDGALDAFFMLFVIDSQYNNMMGGDQYQCIDLTDDDPIYTGTFAFGGTPVPVPGTFILMLPGIVSLAIYRKQLRRCEFKLQVHH